ncbi:hypothetical protein QE379_003175 [Sphingomonas sp. SORGH_AS 879]|nr:hypothetical protein [Sphingomonas sp. SORGH_AS_0879]
MGHPAAFPARRRPADRPAPRRGQPDRNEIAGVPKRGSGDFLMSGAGDGLGVGDWSGRFSEALAATMQVTLATAESYPLSEWTLLTSGRDSEGWEAIGASVCLQASAIHAKASRFRRHGLFAEGSLTASRAIHLRVSAPSREPISSLFQRTSAPCSWARFVFSRERPQPALGRRLEKCGDRRCRSLGDVAGYRGRSTDPASPANTIFTAQKNSGPKAAIPFSREAEAT